jgi:hypothetical protein
MSRSTISTFQLFALFPDEETARVYLEGRIWPDGPVCPACQSSGHISALNRFSLFLFWRAGVYFRAEVSAEVRLAAAAGAEVGTVAREAMRTAPA